MNIHLLVTDVWFYTTLLLTVGYIILALLVYRFLKPYMGMFLKKFSRQPKAYWSGPIYPAKSESSLRDKLYGIKN